MIGLAFGSLEFFLIGAALGSVGGVVSLVLFGGSVRRSALASAKRELELIKKSRLALHESIQEHFQTLELRSVAAISAAVKCRGAPERLLGYNPAMGVENWDVNVTQIEATARCAAAAMAYYESERTTVSPELGGLRFAQWWYGLEDDEPCHERLNTAWHNARMVPTLLERTR